MGMMLESTSVRLMNTVAHNKSPGKNPEIRLKQYQMPENLKYHIQQEF